MNINKMKDCEIKALAFLEALNRLYEQDKYKGHLQEFWIKHSPKERGAVKRASMELTRALADLRRGGRE